MKQKWNLKLQIIKNNDVYVQIDIMGNILKMK